jgi:hypothetical protein
VAEDALDVGGALTIREEQRREGVPQAVRRGYLSPALAGPDRSAQGGRAGVPRAHGIGTEAQSNRTVKGKELASPSGLVRWRFRDQGAQHRPRQGHALPAEAPNTRMAEAREPGEHAGTTWPCCRLSMDRVALSC